VVGADVVPAEAEEVLVVAVVVWAAVVPAVVGLTADAEERNGMVKNGIDDDEEDAGTDGTRQ